MVKGTGGSFCTGRGVWMISPMQSARCVAGVVVMPWHMAYDCLEHAPLEHDLSVGALLP